MSSCVRVIDGMSQQKHKLRFTLQQYLSRRLLWARDPAVACHPPSTATPPPSCLLLLDPVIRDRGPNSSLSSNAHPIPQQDQLEIQLTFIESNKDVSTCESYHEQACTMDKHRLHEKWHNNWWACVSSVELAVPASSSQQFPDFTVLARDLPISENQSV